MIAGAMKDDTINVAGTGNTYGEAMLYFPRFGKQSLMSNVGNVAV